VIFDSTWWLVVTVAAPTILAAAIAFALIKQRRLSVADRRDLREAVDSVYMDDEEHDDCPVRVDTEKREPRDTGRTHRIGRVMETTR
jgi:hypothetical protein